MRVALTGTPGTGKTTVSELLDSDLDVVHVNALVEDEGLYSEVDEDRDSKVADMEAVREWLAGEDDVLVESHLAHLVDVDRVVVLRCAPDELETRLTERGESPRKAEENAESEALDVILSEAVRIHGESKVYEVDTTGRTPEDVAADVDAAIAGDREPSAGDVDFTDYL
ncbi:adenylate kinase family protein [Halobacterium litoreum]|uniref:Putative adenylate kinase n=1 Tax=Halobacterium litoreum TaxID=2039234 RepID=A0ABD5NAI7_9EURY|nr:AAA family ATPase [Halobacterium litoreum]UHH14761.1 AAA family ATPase [Halobacterium litoreum]